MIYILIVVLVALLAIPIVLALTDLSHRVGQWLRDRRRRRAKADLSRALKGDRVVRS